MAGWARGGTPPVGGASDARPVRPPAAVASRAGPGSVPGRRPSRPRGSGRGDPETKTVILGAGGTDSVTRDRQTPSLELDSEPETKAARPPGTQTLRVTTPGQADH